MDPVILAALVGGVCAIVASFMSALLTRSSMRKSARIEKGHRRVEQVVVWPSRTSSYPELERAIEKTENKIIAHDSLWLGKHRAQETLEKALKAGIEVELILAHPKSEIFRYRFRLISGYKSQPHQQEWPEWIPIWKKLYANFSLLSTNHLFSGPFVLVDDVLYLGMFSPCAESNQMPLFEISTRSEAGKILWKNIEIWKKSLESGIDHEPVENR